MNKVLIFFDILTTMWWCLFDLTIQETGTTDILRGHDKTHQTGNSKYFFSTVAHCTICCIFLLGKFIFLLDSLLISNFQATLLKLKGHVYSLENSHATTRCDVDDIKESLNSNWSRWVWKRRTFSWCQNKRLKQKTNTWTCILTPTPGVKIVLHYHNSEN